MLAGHQEGSEVRELTKSDTLEESTGGAKERGNRDEKSVGQRKDSKRAREGRGKGAAAHPIWQRRVRSDGSGDRDGFFEFTAQLSQVGE